MKELDLIAEELIKKLSSMKVTPSQVHLIEQALYKAYVIGFGMKSDFRIDKEFPIINMKNS